jgi:Rod binding domain-containing protein
MKPVVAFNPWDLSAQMAQASRLKASGDERAQAENAARGFENILIRKWIEVARKSSLIDKDSMMGSYQTLGDDQLAAVVTQAGGLGFVKPMADQMLKQIQNRVTDPAALIDSAQKAVNYSGENR